MNPTFFRNIVLLIIINIIVKPLWIFGIDLQVQNTVGTVEYGHYLSLFNYSIIFQIILDLGLQTYNSQRIAQSRNRISWLLPNILTAKAVLALFYFSILVGAGVLTGFRGRSLYMLMALGGAQVLNSFILYFRSCISAMHYYKTDSLFSIADRSVMILLCGYLLYGGLADRFRIEWFIYAQIAAFLCSSILSFLFVIRKAQISKADIQLSKIIPIIRKSAPYALLIFLMSIYLRGDLVILERLNVQLDKAQAGKYAEVFRLLDIANNMTGVLFAGLLLPMFAKNRMNKQVSNELIISGLKVMLPVSITVSIVSYFFGDGIMQLLYKDYSEGDGSLLFTMMLSYPFYCLNYIYGTLLTARGHIKALVVVALVTAIFSITGNMLLARQEGALGIAIICIGSQALSFIMSYVYIIRKQSASPPGWSLILKFFLFGGAIAGICSLFHFLEYHTLTSLIAISAISLVLLFLLKILRPSDIKLLGRGGAS